MSCKTQEEHCIRPITRNNKNFIYKGNIYPISFDSIKNNSNYFFDNSEIFTCENIELKEDIDITEETIIAFIDCCHNKTFIINDSNAFQLDYLSKKYQVPELTKITKEYLSKPNTNLAFESLLFKYQLQNNGDFQSKYGQSFLDTSNEEEIIGHRLNEYINERLLDLTIPIIDRILKKYLKENNNQNTINQIITFLFKCLEKHKRKASVLFLNLSIDNQPNDLIFRLINDYSDIFDFNMVNLKSFLNNSSELLKELTKLKIEYTQKISEMSKIILEQKNEINQFDKTRSLIENDFKNVIKKQNQIIEEQKNEINKINEARNLIDNELKIFMQEQNEINEKNKIIQEEIENQINQCITKEI